MDDFAQHPKNGNRGANAKGPGLEPLPPRPRIVERFKLRIGVLPWSSWLLPEECGCAGIAAFVQCVGMQQGASSDAPVVITHQSKAKEHCAAQWHCDSPQHQSPTKVALAERPYEKNS